MHSLILRLSLLLFCFACNAAWPLSAAARTLVADLSSYHIEIDSAFTGEELLLFGARNGTGDVLISVRGPETRFTVRKKERVMGVWMNREQVTFPPLPQFHLFASSKDFNDIQALPLLTALEIGPEYLSFGLDDALPSEVRRAFMNALLDQLYGESLYSKQDGTLSFMGETLFKARLPFPDTLPRGEYSAEVYLIDKGQLVSMQSIPLHVYKSGLDAFLYDFAHNLPAIYGLAAVLIALLVGWGVNYLFDRFNL